MSSGGQAQRLQPLGFFVTHCALLIALRFSGNFAGRPVVQPAKTRTVARKKGRLLTSLGESGDTEYSESLAAGRGGPFWRQVTTCRMRSRPGSIGGTS